MSTCYDIDHENELISSELLDEIEAFLNKRVDINQDGGPNQAMTLLMELQRQRELVHEIYARSDQP